MARYALEGYFGGFSGQNDNAVLKVSFRDSDSNVLGGVVSIGGVTAADRSNITGLLLRSADGTVPAGTR